MVVLEAMATALAVVAFDVSGVRRSLGATGVIVDDGDVHGFATALSELLADEPRRRSLGAAARARAIEHFDRDRVLADVTAISMAGTAREASNGPT